MKWQSKRKKKDRYTFDLNKENIKWKCPLDKCTDIKV